MTGLFPYLTARADQNWNKVKSGKLSESDQVTFYAWLSSSRVELCGYPWQKSSQSSPILGYPWQSWAQSRPALGQLLTKLAQGRPTLGQFLTELGPEQAHSWTTLDRAGSEMLVLIRSNKKTAFWSESHLESDGFDQNQRGPTERKCRFTL